MDTPFTSALLDRRTLFAAAGAALATPALAATAPAAPRAAAPAGAPSIDFADPVQNLRAFMRLTADVDPAKEAAGWFGGHIFAVVDDKPLQMLCGVEGFGVMRVAPQKDGTYRVLADRESTSRRPFCFEVHRDSKRCISTSRQRTNPDASGNRG